MTDNRTSQLHTSATPGDDEMDRARDVTIRLGRWGQIMAEIGRLLMPAVNTP